MYTPLLNTSILCYGQQLGALAPYMPHKVMGANIPLNTRIDAYMSH